MVGALGPGVVAGGVAVVVAEEGGLGGPGWGRAGPVKPDPHPHPHTDPQANVQVSKKAEITLERGVDGKCNYLREV